jgi:uncharacterized membrane protein
LPRQTPQPTFIMKRILNFFLQGLLFVVPITVSVWILIKSILWIDGLLPFQIPLHIPGMDNFEIPGLGLIAIFVIVTIIGYFGTKYIRNPFFTMVEHAVERTPLIKVVYSSVKDLIKAFVGEKKSFNKPVLVKLEKESQTSRVGFVTRNDLTHIGLHNGEVAVYLPFSYGFNGQMVIVPKENVTPLDVSGTEMMKFIISGGVTEI